MKRRWLIFFLTILAVIFGVALLFEGRNPEQKKLEDYKRELAAKGEKLDPDYWLPPTHDGSNGTAALLNALVSFSNSTHILGISQCQMVANNDAKVIWRYPVHEGSLDFWDAIGGLVRTNAIRYSNVLSAAHADYVDVPYDFVTRQYFAMVTNSEWRGGWVYPSCMESYLMLAFSAHVCLELRQNHPDDASDELVALVDLVQKTFCERNLRSVGDRAVHVGELCDSTWQWLQFTNLSEQKLSQLQAAWERVNVLSNVEPSFATELAHVEERFNATRRKLSLIHKSPNEIFKILVGFAKNDATTKKALSRDALLVRQSYTNEYKEYHDIEEGLETARLSSTNRAAAFANVKSAYVELFHDIALAEAKREMAATAIALKRFQLKNGHFPDSLAELLPAYLKSAPTDFADGQPMRYKLDPDGLFLLYSVELNGASNHSRLGPAKKSEKLRSSNGPDGKNLVWPKPATDAEVAEYDARRARSRQSAGKK